jgi:hypothetical protein
MTGRILIVSIALITVAGCASTSGVVTGTSVPAWYAGTVAPDVEYKAMDGKQTSFHKARQPIAIVAFVAPEGASCCWLDPKIINLANQLWDLPVTVAEFSEPTGQCSHGPRCVEVCNLHKGGVMSLYDAQKLAWKAYGKPPAGTLILIRSDNNIVATGSLSDPDLIVAQAKQLGQKQKESMPGGDRLGIY